MLGKKRTVVAGIEVECPVCGDKHSANIRSFSGNCKNCNAYYRIEKGRVVFPAYLEKAEQSLPQIRTNREVENSNKPEKKELQKSAIKKQKGELLNHLNHFLPPIKKHRIIACFECKKEHEILKNSTSAMCPFCGAYISLKNYEINTEWSRTIQTRGNVNIYRRGKVFGTLVRCHHIRVDGLLNGGVDCSGNFTLSHDAKLDQGIRSRSFTLEKQATLEVSKAIIAQEIIIDGHVYGDIYCHRLVLEPQARLDGDVQTKIIVVKEGAKHRGRITVKDYTPNTLREKVKQTGK